MRRTVYRECFDRIPEDREQSFPCPAGCGGNVTLDHDQGISWQCDKCDWMPPSKEESHD
jgi:predicted RNA-binding Zn-ribbon protein involved in translation (DUF1610 family)